MVLPLLFWRMVFYRLGVGPFCGLRQGLCAPIDKCVVLIFEFMKFKNRIGLRHFLNVVSKRIIFH
jgi:hypothetical protein